MPPGRRKRRGSRRAASRAWTAQAADWALEVAALLLGEAAVGALGAREVAQGPRHQRGAAPAGGHQRLERGARVVHVADPAPAQEAEAAVALLLARQPARGAADRGVGGAAPRRPQGEDPERGVVDLAADRAVRAAGAQQRREEVAAAEVARRGAGRAAAPAGCARRRPRRSGERAWARR